MKASANTDRETLSQAKLKLIEAAKAVDPLEMLRKRPLISMGVLAGIGVALGLNAERLFSPTNVNQAFSLLERAVGLIRAFARMKPRNEPPEHASDSPAAAG